MTGHHARLGSDIQPRTGAKLVNDEMMLPKMGGVRLRMTLDRFLWTERDHVTVGELAEWFPPASAPSP